MPSNAKAVQTTPTLSPESFLRSYENFAQAIVDNTDPEYKIPANVVARRTRLLNLLKLLPSTDKHYCELFTPLIHFYTYWQLERKQGTQNSREYALFRQSAITFFDAIHKLPVIPDCYLQQVKYFLLILYFAIGSSIDAYITSASDAALTFLQKAKHILHTFMTSDNRNHPREHKMALILMVSAEFVYPFNELCYSHPDLKPALRPFLNRRRFDKYYDMVHESWHQAAVHELSDDCVFYLMKLYRGNVIFSNKKFNAHPKKFTSLSKIFIELLHEIKGSGFFEFLMRTVTDSTYFAAQSLIPRHEAALNVHTMLLDNFRALMTQAETIINTGIQTLCIETIHADPELKDMLCATVEANKALQQKIIEAVNKCEPLTAAHTHLNLDHESKLQKHFYQAMVEQPSLQNIIFQKIINNVKHAKWIELDRQLELHRLVLTFRCDYVDYLIYEHITAITRRRLTNPNYNMSEDAILDRLLLLSQKLVLEQTRVDELRQAMTNVKESYVPLGLEAFTDLVRKKHYRLPTVTIVSEEETFSDDDEEDEEESEEEVKPHPESDLIETVATYIETEHFADVIETVGTLQQLAQKTEDTCLLESSTMLTPPVLASHSIDKTVPNLARFELHLTIPSRVIELMQPLTEANEQWFIVGGAVIDLLHGKTPKDFDIVTTASLATIAKHYQGRGQFISTKNTLFQFTNYRDIELAPLTASSDLSQPEIMHGVNGSTVIHYHTRDPKEDAKRRDLTCNTLYYNPIKKELHNPFGGYQDIKNRKIAFIKPTADSLRQDPVRLFRVIRLHAKTNWHLSKEDDAILKNCHLNLPTLEKSKLYLQFTKTVRSLGARYTIPLLAHFNILPRFFRMDTERSTQCLNRLTRLFSSLEHQHNEALLWCLISYDAIHDVVGVLKHEPSQLLKTHASIFSRVLSPLGIPNKQEQIMGCIFMAHFQTKFSWTSITLRDEKEFSYRAEAGFLTTILNQPNRIARPNYLRAALPSHGVFAAESTTAPLKPPAHPTSPCLSV